MPATMPLTAASRPRKSLADIRPSPIKSLEVAEAEWLQDVVAALADAKVKHTAAAAAMKIAEAQLSRQLSGVEHLSARRMGLLPPEFQRAFNVRRARRVNQVVVDAQRRRECFAQAQQMLLAIMESGQ